jgi:hypothetical protein
MNAYFYPERQNVDWLFIDETEIKATELEKHTKNVASGGFVLVVRREKMALFKKGAAKPAAAADAKPAVPAPAPPPAKP